MIEFRATAEDAGKRVDVWVAERTGVGRTRVQEALRSGALVVGERAVRPSYRLEEGDVLRGEVSEAEPLAPGPEDIPLELLYSDDRVLVVDKPAGLVTHPGAGRSSGTLVNALLGLGQELSKRGSERPGIVHRLDKDTSGALLVARDDAAHDFLAAELKARRIQRTYVALVRGRLGDSGTIDAPVGRHPVHRRKMTVTAGGRPAATDFLTLASNDEVSLARVTLRTGRTHQIRVHLAHIGNPVVGDPTYGGRSELSARLGIERPGLHAWLLAFPHPSDGRQVQVVAPIPDDLAGAIAAAGLEVPPAPR